MTRSLGDLEKLLLLALFRLGGSATGLDLLDALESRAGRTVSPGALYNVMHRLEGRGLIAAEIGDSGPARGGRRRKVYELLPEGADEVARAWRQVQQMADGVEAELRARLTEGGGS